MTELVLGVDIGGTKIAAGTVTGEAEIVSSGVWPTLAGEGFERSLSQVTAAIAGSLREGVRAIGICAPGPLNPKTGVVLNPPNLPGWVNVPLARLVSERFSLPCRVENDANAAGLAEWRFGAARGAASVFYVTVSTGIGAGIVLDGQIYHGKNGAAAEGGHVTIDWQGEANCGCGLRGCIEGLASGTALAARASRALGRPVTPEEVARLAAAGDPQAARLFDETCEMLGAWLGSMVSLLDPDIIVIGGGVSRIGDPLFSRLRAIVPRRTINQFAADTPIVPAALGTEVGVLGAACTVL